MFVAEPIENRLFVLVLQHPQEKKEALATAVTTCAALRRSALVVGLSWSNLSRALGRSADPKHWAVLYLGSKGVTYPEPVNFVSQKGNPMPMPPGWPPQAIAWPSSAAR